MSTVETLRTKYRTAKERRELAIYRTWKRLISKPGAMPGAVDEIIMKRFDIYSRSTVWVIRKRVEKRLAEEAKRRV